MSEARGPLVREELAAELIGCTVEELRDWRGKRVGPRYMVVAGQVRYSAPGLIEWLGRDSGPDGWKGGAE
jgi:hypothetical protein